MKTMNNMKRYYLLLTIIALSSAPIFALPDFSMSGGGGGIFNLQWKDAALRDEYKNYEGGDYGHGIKAPTAETQDAMRQGLFDTLDVTAGGGVYGFFDATYAEAGAALIFNRVSQTVAVPDKPNISPKMKGSEIHEFLFIQVNLSLLLKYPFSIGEKWKLFPLLGVDGQIAIGDYDEKLREDFQEIANMGYDMPNLGDFWNSLWIKAGVGADYSLTDSLFLRGEALYGVKLNSAYETAMAGYWAEDLKGVASGVTMRLGVGYKFKTF